MSILEVFKKDKDSKKDDAKQAVSKDSKKKSSDKKKAVKDSAKKTNKSKAKKSSKSTSKVGKLTKGKAHKIVLKPLITEKATDLSMENKYVFKVANTANKIEIKKAVKALYDVTPAKVRVINNIGKKVSRGRIAGRTNAFKKAIVTLKEGDKIEVFAGV